MKKTKQRKTSKKKQPKRKGPKKTPLTNYQRQRVFMIFQRGIKGLGLKGLADHLGTTSSQVHDWLSGRNLPNSEVGFKIKAWADKYEQWDGIPFDTISTCHREPDGCTWDQNSDLIQQCDRCLEKDRSTAKRLRKKAA